MVGGQVLDLEGEEQKPTLKTVEAIHRWKTGALITASCVIGGIVAGGDDARLAALRTYGQALGLMYQIVDDILDVEATSEMLGKTAGKDAARHKMTYPAVMGVEAARDLARRTTAEAKSALECFGKEALMLRLLADYVVERRR
jgi:geranylgeranyl diphosphate synthase type II